MRLHYGVPSLTSRRPCRSFLLAICVLSIGCSQELGPVPLNLTSVRGTVREGQRPVTGGWIEFFPVDGTIGDLRSGRLGRDGSFQIDRVAVGRNLIRFVNIHPESRQLERLFSTMQSQIRRDVTKNSPAAIEIDLIEEAIRLNRPRETTSPVQQPARTGKLQ